ncbi:MAG TPA: proteasome activator [Euzebyales bacterium]|nr:proteasome activator [Euzebyales bacterium]
MNETSDHVIVPRSGVPEAQPEDARGDEISPFTALRLAWMARILLQELHGTELDERARARFRDIYARSVAVLRDAVGPQLADELGALLPELDTEVPTQGELRVAQAQLTGWLEGLMQGVHATLWSQQLTAQHQLEEMRLATQRADDRSTSRATQPYL